jgi:hypothetical protein
MTKLFVVAIDESEHARKAFELAVSLMKEGDRIELVHAMEIQKTPIFDPLHEPLGCILSSFPNSSINYNSTKKSFLTPYFYRIFKTQYHLLQIRFGIMSRKKKQKVFALHTKQFAKIVTFVLENN